MPKEKSLVLTDGSFSKTGDTVQKRLQRNVVSGFDEILYWREICHGGRALRNVGKNQPTKPAYIGYLQRFCTVPYYDRRIVEQMNCQKVQ